MITELELFNKITECLEQKKPFSVLRCGDGEMFALKSIGKTNPTDIENVPFLKHIGYIPKDDDKIIITDNIKKAIINCDILGITTNVGQKWTESKNFFKEITNNNKMYVSADFHHYWVQYGLLLELLRKVDDIFYVSGHNLDENFINLGIKNVSSIIIPKQVKYFGEQTINHYPDVYFETIKKLSLLDLYGKLCLVGGGFIGKYYLDIIKNSGGVAIDIGSGFDMIAGYKTRSTRGKLIIEPKYKI